MTIRVTVAGLLSLACLSSGGVAQVEVAPGEGREAFVAFLAERLAEIDTEDRLPLEDEVAAARVAVDGISGRLAELGVEAVVGKAPKHGVVEMPRSGEALLDAIADYQLCMVSLDAIVQDTSPRESAFQERSSALFLSASVYLVSNYLRAAYLEAGITDERAVGYFQSEPMTAVGARVADDPALRSGVLAACGPVLTELWQDG